MKDDMRSFNIVARSRDNKVFVGAFTARSVSEALTMAKKEKGEWVRKVLGCFDTAITYEVEEDFL
jgi:hypothetical protein